MISAFGVDHGNIEKSIAMPFPKTATLGIGVRGAKKTAKAKPGKHAARTVGERSQAALNRTSAGGAHRPVREVSSTQLSSALKPYEGTGSLNTMLSPYRGAKPKPAAAAGGSDLSSLLSPYRGAKPKPKGIEQLNPAARPLTMGLRSARRNQEFNSRRQPRPGEAMR